MPALLPPATLSHAACLGPRSALGTGQHDGLVNALHVTAERLLRAEMRTYSARAREIERHWYVVDAKDQVLGRLASRVAQVLRGKHKPMFTPHLDVGDYVIVVNAAEVRLTGEKASQKFWHRHSGYPGGLKSVPFARLLAETPEKAVEKAIRGMLPKNKLGRRMATKLKVYAGPEHPHEAQQPKPLALQVAPAEKR